MHVVSHFFVKDTRTKNYCLLIITHISSDTENERTWMHSNRRSSSLYSQSIKSWEHRTIWAKEHRNAIPSHSNQPRGMREFQGIDSGRQWSTTNLKKSWPNYKTPKVGQPWPRPKLALNLKIVRQEIRLRRPWGQRETPGITQETPRQVLTNIIKVKLRCLYLCWRWSMRKHSWRNPLMFSGKI